MSIEAMHTPALSRQPRSVSGWLTTNRLKRGALLYWAALFTGSAAVIHGIGLLAQPPQSSLLVALLLGFTVIQAAIALAVVAAPVRRLLIAAVVTEGAGALLWIVAHTSGIPDGFTVWRPETLSVPDLYLPAMEGVSAFFFLCLCGRTWTKAPKSWRIVLVALPYLLLVSVLIWALMNRSLALVSLAIFFLAAGLPTSLLDLFLPAVIVLAVFLFLRLIFPRLRAMTPRAWRTALILLPALLVINILAWTGSISATNTVWFPASSTVHAPAGQTTTLEYCRPGGNPLAMDLSEPSAQAPRPAPVVFYIHGGEGLLGSRALEDGSADGMYFTQLRAELLGRGFVVGTIDYGLAPLHKIQAQVQDARCAVRFLRAHAGELGIDPQRIGVYGASQGGYLAAMLGTVGSGAGFDVGQYLDQSSRVQAVVDMWGFTDLANFSGSPGWVHDIGQAQSGGGISLAHLSPVTYVAPGDPPFLIIHGADDWFIAPHHSQELAKLLHAAGVPATLVLVQHNGHGLDAPTAGQIEQPGPAALIHMISAFFASTLAA